jgi:hypothetical protein
MMIKKRIGWLIACFLAGIFLVVSLFLITENERKKSNSFIRLLPSHLILPGNIIDLKSSRWYFAGKIKDHIYMGNAHTPIRLKKLDLNLKNVAEINLGFPNGSKFYDGSFNLIDGVSIYTLDGNQPQIYSGEISDYKLKPIKKPPYFTQGISTGKNSFVLRVVLNGQNRLLKYEAKSGPLEIPANVLEKQVDGIFCTDGNLVTVPGLTNFVYVYYYRNQFVYLDSSLNILYKGKTIDTNTRAKIKVAAIKSQNQTTLSAPPVYVNKQSAANEKYLFIHSGLKGDNETAETLDRLSVIDVYAIKDGKYQFSFYLPNLKEIKLTDFRVYGQSLYALYDHYLYKYQLNF